MKILVINCGSSSLKYQLIDMDGEKVLCKGLCERIGMESSMITHEANGHKATTPAIFPTHTEAFAEVVKKMAGVVALWPLASWVIMLLSMPMRSHRPLHSTFSPSISMS